MGPYDDVAVADVTDLVPELRLDPDAPDVAATVDRMVAQVAPIARVALDPLFDRLDAYTADAAVAARVDNLRAAVVPALALGAASLLQDSRYPELAGADRTDQRWGAVLWARYEAALAALAAALTAELLEQETVSPTGDDQPAVSAPAATFHDRMRF